MKLLRNLKRKRMNSHLSDAQITELKNLLLKNKQDLIQRMEKIDREKSIPYKKKKFKKNRNLIWKLFSKVILIPIVS